MSDVVNNSNIDCLQGNTTCHISYCPEGSQYYLKYNKQFCRVPMKLINMLCFVLVFVSPERMFVETHSDPNSVCPCVRASVRPIRPLKFRLTFLCLRTEGAGGIMFPGCPSVRPSGFPSGSPSGFFRLRDNSSIRPTWWNFIKLGTGVHHQEWMNWLDFGRDPPNVKGQRSMNLF